MGFAPLFFSVYFTPGPAFDPFRARYFPVFEPRLSALGFSVRRGFDFAGSTYGSGRIAIAGVRYGALCRSNLFFEDWGGLARIRPAYSGGREGNSILRAR